MNKVKLYLKKYLTQLLIRVILGKISPHYLAALVEDATRSTSNMFGRKGYVYREVKEHYGTGLSQGELDLATQLVLFLNDTNVEIEGTKK